ncbi:hypothetical protein [Acanthopleuribacter pedis]|uniref:Lipoprotein n=1 Tax=Acanthopleuribacter pedis TaxID=442870 RepID=A0A8J7QC49_9BACT|nr:hypothetical protein [Acanthopleuribacter pedis]MBO1316835.1 hypothetical protein [Acanthopleuribacter pedis]
MKSILIFLSSLAMFIAAGSASFPNEPDDENPRKRAHLTVRGVAETKPAAHPKDDTFDPLEHAVATFGKMTNYEATVPPQCYTKTAGTANPCYTCHTGYRAPNEMSDWELQEEYAFSDFAMTNRWFNLFKDRGDFLSNTTDEEILSYVREDNYTPLKKALADRDDYQGYRPDLDLAQGFDEDGFANDGSHWRALRYKPFLGTFWPTNGSTDDVFIRLPEKFRTLNGKPSRAAEKANFAILEAVIAAGPKAGRGAKFRFTVEPIDETAIAVDLNKDGELTAEVTDIVGFPKTYVADAADEKTRQYVYPKYIEFLHSVRYLDPEKPDMIATRMKELRYSRKIRYLDSWAMSYVYEREYNEKEEGTLPQFYGSPMVGISNDFGWMLQGFIEDAKGRLRLQTQEEHQFCMGCHSAVGATVDQTFTLARKVPGRDGWRYQDPVGMSDVPQQGNPKPEIALYFERVGGGDEFRANQEVLERFFEDGKPRETDIARAAPGGDKDITWLIAPSRERALNLNRAYLEIVKEQSFKHGRDALLGPIDNVHQRIENGNTDLSETGKVFKDGMLWLDWSAAKKK